MCGAQDICSNLLLFQFRSKFPILGARFQHEGQHEERAEKRVDHESDAQPHEERSRRAAVVWAGHSTRVWTRLAAFGGHEVYGALGPGFRALL